MRPLPMLARAARLRCPHCGVGHVMRSWLAVAERCPECGLRFERDEENEYWLGALLATWPRPPWRLLLWGGVVQMIVTPIVFYPFAKALWLAVDLTFRPVKPEDLGSREPG